MRFAHRATAFSVALFIALASVAAAADQPAAPAGHDTEWHGYNGESDATRFSPLTQIDMKNAAELQEVARFKIPETLSFQCGPVVIGDTMYITTVKSTYAIDARTGEKRWARTIEPQSQGIGTPVRGAAFDDGRLFRGTMDGHVIALDAKTGEVIWDVQGVDYKTGEYYTAVPVVFNGLVIIGNSGSDMGGVGHIRAFDARSGKQVWNFDNVPSSGEAAKTWPDDPNKIRAGGGMYSSFALDPEAGLLYSPVGNPGPDFVKDYRPGDNLYTCGVAIAGGIVTYMLGGKPYVAIAGGMKNAIVQTESGPAWVAIFALPEK